MKQSLPIHEWLIVVLLLGILTLLIIITWTHREPSFPQTTTPHFMTPQEIEVIVEGKVEKPGTYRLKKGTKLEELLTLCGPLPEADLDRLKLTKILKDGQKVKIVPKEEITVFIKGAVKQEISVTVPSGTTLEQLLGKIECLPNADIKKLQKKRKLKDQEIVHVPTKKTRKSTKVDEVD